MDLENLDPQKIDITENVLGMKIRVLAEKKPGDLIWIFFAAPFVSKDFTVPSSFVRDKLKTLLAWVG